jgi:broad specificity polyphosphatase/5'/3'-nucleotidase SurE
LSPRDAAMVQRGLAFVIGGIDVGAELLDEILHGGQHAGRREAVRVGAEAFTVSGARPLQRRDRGPPPHRRA